MFLQICFMSLPVVFPALRSIFIIAPSIVLFLAAVCLPYILWYRFVRRVRTILSIVKKKSNDYADDENTTTSTGTAANGLVAQLVATGVGIVVGSEERKGEGTAIDSSRSFAYRSAAIPVSSSGGGKKTKKSPSSPSSSTSSVTIRLVRRAIVVVGGDFARSPRMQYHAISLSDAKGTEHSSSTDKKSSSSSSSSSVLSDATTSSVTSQKLFDEVILVGYDCGNKLSEEVQRRSYATPSSSSMEKNSFTPISSEGLFAPPQAPQWLLERAAKLGGRRAAWAANAIYKVLALTALLFIRLPQLMLPSIVVTEKKTKTKNSSTSDGTEENRTDHHCDNFAAAGGGGENYYCIDIVVPQIVLCQTPPAIPFIPIVKAIAGLLSVIPDVEGRWAKLLAIECGVSVDNSSERSSNNKRNSSSKQRSLSSSTPSLPSPSMATPLPMWLSGFTRPPLAVDWHNFGYTIMAGDKRPSWMVAVYKSIEMKYCKGLLNLTVSEAMRKALTMTVMAAEVERARFAAENTAAAAGNVTSANQNTKKKSSNSDGSATTTFPLPKDITPFAFPSSTVTVLHDHSPSFFNPIDARTFIEKVLPAFSVTDATALHPVPSWVLAQKQREMADDGDNENDAATREKKEKKRDNSSSDFSTVGTTTDSDNKKSSTEDFVMVDTASAPVSPLLSSSKKKEQKKDSSSTNGQAVQKGRIIVASTSWTADDDYTIVINALKAVDAELIAFNEKKTKGKGDEDNEEEAKEERHLWFVATGKGVARPKFEQQVLDANFSPFLRVTCIYFQSLATYAQMLGGSDAGLSLHYSSSGLDLPMKCVDMLGAGLPVLSLRYPAIGELVDEEGRAGWLFSTEEELSRSILDGIMGISPSASSPSSSSPSFSPWADVDAKLAVKRAYIAANYSKKWDDDWEGVALPAIERVLGRNKKVVDLS